MKNQTKQTIQSQVTETMKQGFIETRKVHSKDEILSHLESFASRKTKKAWLSKRINDRVVYLQLLSQASTEGWKHFYGQPIHQKFVELGKSLERQPAGVAETVGRLRLLLIATWGVYPIAYIFNIVGDASASSFVTVQVGYTVADVLAKCVFGLTILKIARMKSMAEGMKDDH